MAITTTLTNKAGHTVNVEYHDATDGADYADRKFSAVHAFCFYNDQLVIVYAKAKEYWTPPGGRVEEGERVEDALQREVQEETNMRVITQRCIGWQDVWESGKEKVSHARFVCLVEPYGDFSTDPDGDVTEIRFIDPKEYKAYVDWGAIGDRLMERALAIKVQMQS